MMESTINWRNANEDNVSTGSGGSSNSDHEINSRQACHNSESRLLRFPNVRRVVPGSNPKALITTLSLTSLVVLSAVLGTLYYFGGNGNGPQAEIDRKIAPSSEHDIFVRDLEDVKLSQVDLDDEEMQSDMPAHASSTRNSTKNKKRKRVQHGPRPLPPTANEAPAFSLLYQLKLVHGRDEDFVNYTKCEDINMDGKKFFKGWKASFPVNYTAAGFAPGDHNNTFVGYGKKRSIAKTRAAQLVLTTLYPGKLEYPVINDPIEIETYCSDPNEQVDVQNDAANKKTSPLMPQVEQTKETDKRQQIKTL